MQFKPMYKWCVHTLLLIHVMYILCKRVANIRFPIKDYR